MADNQEGAAKTAPAANREDPRVEWDDAKMHSSYANVVNAASTREEISLFFGTNRTWSPAEDNTVKVELTDRIIMSPFAAKRLMLLLREYENRHGKLVVGVPQAAPQSPAAPAAEAPDSAASGE
jgi:hypothetical protein